MGFNFPEITLLVDNQSPEFPSIKEEIGVVLDETCVPEVITARQLGKVMAGIYKNWDQAVYDADPDSPAQSRCSVCAAP